MKKARGLKSFEYKNYYRIKDSGIYFFWLDKRCIYIGKAENQTIGDRLKQHRMYCHNENLDLTLDVYGSKIQFCFLPILKRCKIESLEEKFIIRLQPRCNKYLK